MAYIEKINWQSDEIVNPADLNRIEAGIGANDVAITAYTAADVLTKLKTVDGIGSGLDADLLDGLASGNATGNIPVSNGTLNVNLNADKLDGLQATAFATSAQGTLAVNAAPNTSLVNLAGTGRTTETVKGNANAVVAHLADLITDTNGTHGLRIEIGAWTPVFKGFLTTGVCAYSKQAGIYYKIGQMVYVEFDVRISNITTKPIGYYFLDGLPFATATSSTINNINHFTFSANACSGGVSESFRKILGADLSDTQIQLKIINAGLIDNAVDTTCALVTGANNIWLQCGGWYIAN